jgi:hypothetical protein
MSEETGMNGWTPQQLEHINAEGEVEIATALQDGGLRRPVIVWIVRDGDDLFVRSYRGPSALWYRGALLKPEGNLIVGTREHAVRFEPATPDRNDQIDAAYRDKYGRYGASYIAAMTSPEVRATTLRIVPIDR